MAEDLVDLVIPVYNEAHVLEGSVTKLHEYLEKEADFPWRIVVVNNGSTDATAEVARRLEDRFERFEFVNLDRKGRGFALYTTWTTTDAEYSIYMDADLSTDLSAVGEVVGLLREGADIVSGTRLHAKSRIERCLKREILSRFYNRLIRWVMWTRSFGDAQCGFKGVRVETVRPLLEFIENRHWFFDTEMLVLGEYASMKIAEVPVVWIEDRDTRVNVPKTVMEDLKGLLRLRCSAKRIAREFREKR